MKYVQDIVDDIPACREDSCEVISEILETPADEMMPYITGISLLFEKSLASIQIQLKIPISPGQLESINRRVNELYGNLKTLLDPPKEQWQ